MKYILITGSSSGIGYATVKEFLKNGYHVIGIDVNHNRELEEMTNYQFFLANITKKEDLKIVANYLENNAICLEMIVNIAGIHDMLSLIESDYDKIKRVIDINLSGTMFVNNTFYKYLSNKGRIVIVTSEVAKVDPLPFNGIYSISKIALDAYAQSLRQELNLRNQKVITIRPGAIETPLSRGSNISTNRFASETKYFENESVHFSKIVSKFAGKPMDVNKFGRYIYKVTTKKRPKYTYNKHHNLGLMLLGILPKRLQCSIVKLLLNRKKK